MMGNALNEDIDGAVVVLKAEHLKPELGAVEQRMFRVTGGFGAKPFTMGNAIFGEFLIDGEKCRMEGWMVERIATEGDMASLLAARADPADASGPPR
jgi:hypothetical protein